MKQLKMLISIGVLFFSLGLPPAWSSHSGVTDLNTVSVDSQKLGIKLTPATLRLFTQDGSGTVLDGNPLTSDNYFPTGNPGAFTNNPNNCIASFADFGFGNDCGGGNDAMTAPNFGGPGVVNDAIGTIESKISLDFVDPLGTFSISGNIDFCLNQGVACDAGNSNEVRGLATISQTITQGIDLGSDIGNQTITIDNTNKGAPVTFMTVVGQEEFGSVPARNIPWSIDITQDVPSSSGKLHLVSSGIFAYELNEAVETTQNIGRTSAYRFDGLPCQPTGFDRGRGLSGSCWPNFGTFDLPGFDSGRNNFPLP